MVSVLLPIGALLLSVAFLLMGNGLQQTLLPVRANLEDFNAVQIGVMGSSYFLGFSLGCVYAGAVVRRVGHVRTFTALASVASTIALLHSLSVEPVSWWLLRALTGFCFAGLYMVIESWLNDRADNANRGFVMGTYTMINLSVIVAGQLMLTLDDPQRFGLFALASILVSLAAVPVALTVSPQPAPIAEARLRPVRLIRLSPVGAAGAATVGIAGGSFWALGPAYAARLEADTTAIALFMSVVVIGGALAQWPVGRLSDRFDRRRVLIGAAVLASLASLGLVLFARVDGPLVTACAFLFGTASLPIYAISAAHTHDHANRADLVETTSGLLLMNGMGAIAGPILAALTMREIGPGGLFAFTGVCYAALALFALWRLTQRAPVPIADRAGFDLVTTAATMVAMDPTALDAAARDTAPESKGPPEGGPEESPTGPEPQRE